MNTLPHQEFYTTQAASDTERLERIEAMLWELLRVLCPDRDNGIGPASYERAIRELAKGNRKPLTSYVKRGGKIPKQVLGG
jgi:hypothetical protein